jgi:hypothetical protein
MKVPKFLRVDYWKLAAAMYPASCPLPFSLEPSRCILCGRLLLGNSIAQYDKLMGLYYICYNHGGNDGCEYVDALTGCSIHVGPEPTFVRRVVSNLATENWYWFRVGTTYIWLVIREIVIYVAHPIKYIRYKYLMKQMAWEETGE